MDHAVDTTAIFCAVGVYPIDPRQQRGGGMRRGREVRTDLIMVLALTTLAGAGCTSVRLRHGTIRQGSTLPDLQYQQVLDNLARFAANPEALPWHVNLREGTSQVTDSASGGAAVDLGPPSSTLPQLFGSRTVVAQWGMAPLIEPVPLRLLRVAYRRALGVPEMPGAELLDELAHELKSQIPSNADLRDESDLFYDYQAVEAHNSREFDARIVTTNDDHVVLDPPGTPPRERSPLVRNVCRQIDSICRELAQIGPGWYHVGTRHDVPHDACYVGHHGDCYVWVGPDGRAALTELTLTVLRIGGLVKETQSLISPGSVKFSPGDRGG